METEGPGGAVTNTAGGTMLLKQAPGTPSMSITSSQIVPLRAGSLPSTKQSRDRPLTPAIAVTGMGSPTDSTQQHRLRCEAVRALECAARRCKVERHRLAPGEFAVLRKDVRRPGSGSPVTGTGFEELTKSLDDEPPDALARVDEHVDEITVRAGERAGDRRHAGPRVHRPGVVHGDGHGRR